MRTNYAEKIIEAWNTVMEAVSTRRLMGASVQPAPNYPDRRDICAYISITGDISGQVTMCMDAQTGKVIASEMLGGMEIPEVDELVISAVGELCNMIMGSLCASIGTIYQNLDITPPTVITREQPPQSAKKPLYQIAFLVEDLETIDFHVAV